MTWTKTAKKKATKLPWTLGSKENNKSNSGITKSRPTRYISANGKMRLPSYKIILLGDSGVGKSNLLLRFTKDTFFKESKSTIGVEFFTKIVQVQDNTLVRGQIWDTAGQERFRLIASSYYRKSVGAFLVYDVSSRKSFENIPRWLKEVEENADENCLTMLIGNKSDKYIQNGVEDENNTETPVVTPEVSFEDGRKFAEKNGMSFCETSALNSKNVSKAFQGLIQNIHTLRTEKSRFEDEDKGSDDNASTADRRRNNFKRACSLRQKADQDYAKKIFTLRQSPSKEDIKRKEEFRSCCSIQ